MNPPEKPPQFEVKPEDWSNWLQQLQSESERGLATIAAAILDHLLARLIESFVLEDNKTIKEFLGRPYSPLGTFAARITAAYLFGLISEDEFDDLNAIRSIRNEFVHQSSSPSFSDESISQRVHNLKIPELMPTEVFNPETIQPRRLFSDAVAMLFTFIYKRADYISERRISPPNFIIG